MDCRALYFVGPREVEIRREKLPGLSAGQVMVETCMTAISPGTEMLIYRGQAPRHLPADETIAALSGELEFPLQYGYAAVGEVVRVGKGLDRSWKGKRVFAFHPHQTRFAASPGQLLPVPEDLEIEDAVFLPNMETAVNFIMDGRPMFGEQVAVFGQGIVGLLTTALLAYHPLASLVTLDRHAPRRRASLELGAHHSLDPADTEIVEKARAALQGDRPHAGADLVYELSGSPQALDAAIAVAGFDGRVVVGSWYGQKRADLDLGGSFHRKRVRLVGSQVSTLTPELSGRWNKARRFQVAWEMLRRVRPSRFITHRFPLAQAGEAYQLLDEHPETAIQVIFDYR